MANDVNAAAFDKLEYVGFWARVGAAVIDTLLILVVTMPLLFWIYGASYLDAGGMAAGPADVMISYVFPFIATIIFWKTRQATPGKMAVRARIVDARTGDKPGTAQLIGRYFAYIPAMLPLGLGIFWVGFDPRKQGWHDKMAGTVVVRGRG